LMTDFQENKAQAFPENFPSFSRELSAFREEQARRIPLK
jgi:hypothetical protein